MEKFIDLIEIGGTIQYASLNQGMDAPDSRKKQENNSLWPKAPKIKRQISRALG